MSTPARRWAFVAGPIAGLAVALGLVAYLSVPRASLAPGDPTALPPASPVSARTREAIGAPTASPLPYRELVAAAQADPDPRSGRVRLWDALESWGATDPAAAVRWATAQSARDRAFAVAAALSGAAHQPRVAMPLARALFARDSALAAECGPAFLDALAAQGNFVEAVQFATAAAPGNLRDDWRAMAFESWAERRPAEALAAYGERPGSGDPVFRALVDGYAKAQPGSLADYAFTLPAGDDRAYALHASMNRWSVQDPGALSAWLGRFPPSPELDRAIALLVSEAPGTHSPPDIAAAWAERIADPELRAASIRDAVREWAALDPAAARDFLVSTPGLPLEQRMRLLRAFDAERRSAGKSR